MKKNENLEGLDIKFYCIKPQSLWNINSCDIFDEIGEFSA